MGSRIFSYHHYLDPNLRNFFLDGYKLSLHEFDELIPLVVHNLRDSHLPQRRPVTLFCHSRDRLRKICDRVGSHFVEDQMACRRGIGESISEPDSSLRSLVDEIVAASGTNTAQWFTCYATGS